ncbi:MAG: hypothetical protein AAGM36_19050 [Cyanobacteria bacterium J06597_1]
MTQRRRVKVMSDLGTSISLYVLRLMRSLSLAPIVKLVAAVDAYHFINSAMGKRMAPYV